MPRPFFKVVDCGMGWMLIQKGLRGRVKHSCGWASKGVPMGRSPQKYQERLESLTREHMRKAHG